MMTSVIDDPHPEIIAHFALMNAAPDAMERFWHLYVDTNAYIDDLEARGDCRFSRCFGVGDANHVKRWLFGRVQPEHLDVELASRWDAWGKEYDEIFRSSPKWRMKELIQEICEVDSGRSWPDGTERDYWYWAMAENGHEEVKFLLREDIIESYRKEMHSLVEECGGFLYTSDENGWIAFASNKELPAVWQRTGQLLPSERQKLWAEKYDEYDDSGFKQYDPAQERFALVGLWRLMVRWLARKF